MSVELYSGSLDPAPQVGAEPYDGPLDGGPVQATVASPMPTPAEAQPFTGKLDGEPVSSAMSVFGRMIPKTTLDVLANALRERASYWDQQDKLPLSQKLAVAGLALATPGQATGEGLKAAITPFIPHGPTDLYRQAADTIQGAGPEVTPQDVAEHPVAAPAGGMLGGLLPIGLTAAFSRSAPATSAVASMVMADIMSRGGEFGQTKQEGGTDEQAVKSAETLTPVEMALQSVPSGHAAAAAIKGGLGKALEYGITAGEQAVVGALTHAAHDLSANYWLKYKHGLDSPTDYAISAVSAAFGGVALHGAAKLGGTLFPGQEQRTPITSVPFTSTALDPAKIPKEVYAAAQGLTDAYLTGDPTKITTAKAAFDDSMNKFEEAVSGEKFTLTPEGALKMVNGGEVRAPWIPEQLGLVAQAKEKLRAAPGDSPILSADEVSNLASTGNGVEQHLFSNLRKEMDAKGQTVITRGEASDYVQSRELPLIVKKVDDNTYHIISPVNFGSAWHAGNPGGHFAEITGHEDAAGRFVVEGISSRLFDLKAPIKPHPDPNVEMVRQAIRTKEQAYLDLYRDLWGGLAVKALAASQPLRNVHGDLNFEREVRIDPKLLDGSNPANEPLRKSLSLDQDITLRNEAGGVKLVTAKASAYYKTPLYGSEPNLNHPVLGKEAILAKSDLPSLLKGTPTTGEVLTWIENKGADSIHRLLAKWLTPRVDLTTRIINKRGGGGDHQQGRYPPTNEGNPADIARLRVGKTGTSLGPEEVSIHEILHDLTSRAIRGPDSRKAGRFYSPEQRQAAEELQRLYLKMKTSDTEFSRTYGAKDVHEFLSELASLRGDNPLNYLQDHPGMSAQTPFAKEILAMKGIKDGTLASEYLDNFSKLLGMHEPSGHVFLGEGPVADVLRSVNSIKYALHAVDPTVRQRVMEEINRVTTGAHKVRMKELIGTVIRVRENWSLPYEIQVFPSGEAFEKMIGQKNPPNSFGAFYKGKVYVFGDKVHTGKDIERVILHEVLGEVGIRGVLGDTAKPILETIYKLDQRVRLAAQPQVAKGVPVDTAVAGVLAKMSENVANLVEVKGMARITAAARLFLRANGLSKLLRTWNTNDTAYLLQAARNYKGVENLEGPFFSSGLADNALPPGLSNLQQSLEDPGLVTFNKIYNLAAGLEQITRANPDNPFVKTYTDLTRMAHWLKAKWAGRIESRIKELKKLGDKPLSRVFQHALDTAVASRELGRRFTPEELAARMRDAGLSEKEAAVYLRIDSDFQEALSNMKDVAMENLLARQAKAAADPTTPQATLKKFKEEEATLNDIFSAMQNRNYFPLSRFGEYLTTVRATQAGTHDGVAFREGEILWSGSHESEKDQQKELSELQSEYAGLVGQGIVKVSYGKRAEYGQTGGHIPQGLEDTLRNRLALSAEQSAMLAEIMLDLSPSKSFAKRLQRAKNIKGWSEEGPRAYADYFIRYATYLANAKFNEQQQQVLNDMARAAQTAADPNKWMDLRNWLQRHKDYMRNPDNSLGWLRSLVTVWQLGLNPKAAFVNLTQLPLVTLPYLAQRYGLRSAQEMLNPRSWYAVGTHIGRIIDSISAEPSKMGDPEHTKVLGEGADEVLFEMWQRQLLDQGLAVHMANWADGAAGSRVLGGLTAAKVADTAMWMFQGVEKVNRRITAMATFRLEMEKRGKKWSELAPGEKAEVKDIVAAAIRDTGFEYATYNRPAMMRGKAGAAFVFKTYGLQALFNVVHDKKRWPYIMALFVSAGLMGLPGMENFQDLLDGLKGYAGKLGIDSLAYEEPTSVVISKLLHKYFPSGTVDMLLHGVGKDYGLGPIHALTAVGIPIPHVDITSSLSQGDVVPGTKLFKELGVGQGDQGRLLQAVASDVFGAAGAFNANLLQALADPGNLAKAAPTIWKNLSAAYDLAFGNGPTRANGTPMGVVQMTPQEAKAAALVQAFGFKPTDVSKAKEAEYGLTETRVYWNARQNSLLNKVFEAGKDGSKEDQDNALKLVRDFNARAPLPMRLTREGIARSIKERALGAVRQENLGTRDPRTAPMAKEFYDAAGLDTSKLPFPPTPP